MPLTKLQFNPGINKELTAYSNEGGWNDGDRIRFRFGYPEKIRGWQKYSTNTYLGLPRNLHPWTNLENDRYLAVGTNRKYYIESGGAYNDITPIRLSIRKSVSISVGTTGVFGTGAVSSPTTNASAPFGNPMTGSVGTVTISNSPGVIVPVGV